MSPPQVPYWYPLQTNAGAIREDRIVFPIPPGVHWSEVRAVEVPRAGAEVTGRESGVVERRERSHRRPATHDGRAPSARLKITTGGLRFAEAAGEPSPEKTARAPKPKRPAAAAKAGPAGRRRIDPTYLAAARELRDRWMERVNGGQGNAGWLDGPRGKYAVSRTVAAGNRIAGEAGAGGGGQPLPGGEPLPGGQPLPRGPKAPLLLAG